ncbi:LCP family protein [Demequina sp.]|uniref:LCP family protein n=1 Tax=Demequina sp. TaxID=2050685 RepID=UPI003A89B33C
MTTTPAPSTTPPAPGKRVRTRSRKRKAWIWVGAIVGVLVLAAGGTYLGIRASINANIEHIPNALPEQTKNPSDGTTAEPGTDEPAAIETGDPINFLVMGSDSRQSGGDPTDWEYGAQRSDVLMMVQISGDRESVNVMSIPRDSWVPVPGYGTTKINAAFSYGGAPLSVQTVHELTGVTIDHLAIIDFASFEELTDTLGGVTITTSKGDQTMNGEEALTFVRERYSLPGGDFDRVRRQQAWMEAILRETFNQDILASVPKISEMINIVLDYSALDEGLNFDTLLSMATSMRNVRPDNVNFFTAPVTGTGMEGSASVVYLDNDRLDQVAEAWRNDTVDALIEEDPEVVRMLHSEPVY